MATRGWPCMAAVAGALAVSAPRLALAQSAERWELRYAAPDGDCPSEANVRTGIAQLLGPNASEGRDGAGALWFRAEIQRAGGRWALALSTTRDGVEERRTLEDERCAPLTDAMALIVAMAIDPTVASRMSTTTPVTSIEAIRVPSAQGAASEQRTGVVTSAVEPARDAPSAVQPRATIPPRPALPAATPLARPVPPALRRWTIGAGASVDSGILPAPAIGVQVWGAVAVRALRVELSLGYWPERSAAVPSRPTVGGAVSAFSARATGCYIARWTWVSLGACAGLEGAVSRGRGAGVSNPGEALSPWVALGVEGRVSFDPTPWLSLVLQGGGALALARPEFFLENIGTFFQSPLAAARATLGPEVHF
jgi:hypothetical protein